ncbi:MAG: hypothetical protein K9L17_06620 [Clostridiales bacterium]|nr:hypothetical protein [Clostridiales bacterium]MCF8022346.1 hypothetical protein [Clostridiales bacterium]
MSEKHSLETFISYIDKVVSGESISPSECEDYNEENKELLFLAQLLAKADYTPESKGGPEKMEGEMEDDELDMVAGGIKLDDIFDEKGKKNGT